MPQKEIFDFFQQIITKCHVRFCTLPLSKERLDLGLRDILGQNSQNIFQRELTDLKSCRLYRLQDGFFCRYMFFLLPESTGIACMGPYLSQEISNTFLLEIAEKCGADPFTAAALRRYYASLPILSDDNPIFIMLHTFLERCWGTDKYITEDINPSSLPDIAIKSAESGIDAARSRWLIENIEQRYSYENRLMEAVQTGQTHKLRQLMRGFNGMSFEKRATEEVRNLKNYCIIMNTLLRKAIEKGGVHPYHIDRLSSDFAAKIEAASSTSQISALVEEMFVGYCRSVTKYAAERYSPPVRKALLYIEASISGELSLKKLANEININPSYLSDLFKKETGSTVTEHINNQRINRAMQMLKETSLQVQTVAQYCGIQDVNYFSKVFKKHTGKTPLQYRKEITGNI